VDILIIQDKNFNACLEIFSDYATCLGAGDQDFESCYEIRWTELWGKK